MKSELRINIEVTSQLAENPESHRRRTKHIQTRHFFIRELLVVEQQIRDNHVPAEFQLTDFWTKPLHIMTLWQAMGLI